MPRANPHTLRGTATERQYFAWLSGFPCCLSGRTDAVQLAHTGDHKDGKGMAQKAHVSTVLPLHHLLHAAEERGRREFWKNAFPGNRIPYARRLFEMFEQDDWGSGWLLIMDMNAMANRDYLASILKRAA